MGVRRILAGVLSAPLLLLSACGGDDESIADPPVASGPPSTAPTHPAKQESAEHFIRRFYAAEKKMENTGRTRTYLKMTRGCQSCVSLTQQVTRFYQGGGFVRWGGLKIASIKPNHDAAANRGFAVTGLAAPTTYRASENGIPQHLAGGRTSELLTLEPAGRSWRVASFAKLGQ